MKIRVHTAIQTIDGVVQPGDYGYISAEKYGTARNSKPEPGIAFGRCTLSDKEVAYHEKNGSLEYIQENDMSNLPVVKTECAVIAITPDEQIKQASEMARLLKDVVNKAGLAKNLGGKKEHLDFEAWQTIARWHHCTPSTEWTRPIKNGEEIIGWEARVNVLDETGRVIGSSEGMCMRDEKTWMHKPSYALRSMAQTRTAGKALRSLFAHVAVLAGYSPTPAEEMDGVEINNHHSATRQTTKTTPVDSNEASEQQKHALLNMATREWKDADTGEAQLYAMIEHVYLESFAKLSDMNARDLIKNFSQRIEEWESQISKETANA